MEVKRFEKKLHDLTVSSLVSGGLPVSEANEMVSAWMQKVKEESRREWTNHLPPNYGDILLEQESKNHKIHQMLEKARADGGTKQDIQNWWNMHDLERRMMLENDENARFAFSIDWLKTNVPNLGKLPEGEKSKAFDDADFHARRSFTIFGDPSDTTHTCGDDRPLPHELKIRVNNYIQLRQLDPNYHRDIMESSTSNALVRGEIAAGRL